MRKQIIPFSYEDINDILDEHVINEEPFTFLVYGELAEYIEMYLYEEFNIEDEEPYGKLVEDDVEYFVSYLPPQGDRTYFFALENARVGGELKYSDLGKSFYYIFTDTPLDEIRDKFGSEGIIYFCELEDCENDDCDCCDCDEYEFAEDIELTEEQEEKLRVLLECLEDILAVDGCPSCTFEILAQACNRFEEIGFQNCKDLMQCVLDDLD